MSVWYSDYRNVLALHEKNFPFSRLMWLNSNVLFICHEENPEEYGWLYIGEFE